MLDNLIKERTKKLERYKNFGNPYPARIRRDLTLVEAVADFEKLELSKKNIAIVGRVSSWRDQGKIIFADIEDESGKFQLVFNDSTCNDFSIAKETIDTGDFLAASGSVFKTKRGEKSLLVVKFSIAAKSLRPVPITWYGLADTEMRLRKRYLDLLSHPDVREVFRKKNIFWHTVREELGKKGFLEVELPVLEAVPGGADAEPFVTHHHALGRDFYLRISLELPLKRLLVGGFEKVFEIGRIFRNEGIDREHLQDYTQMECYWAYADYEQMMEFTEALYKKIVKAVLGKAVSTYSGQTINWDKKWKRVDYYGIFEKESGLDLRKAVENDLIKKAKDLKLAPEKHLGRGRLIDLIYKKVVRPKLVEPCFLIDPPTDVEPLAKRKEDDPGRVERFQIMAGGTELGKGFSELNDPLDQRKRFGEQMRLREKGDKEAQRLDEDFLEALEYGMPPAAGFGMSERFFAVLMDKPVRETVIFPLMKEGNK